METPVAQNLSKLTAWLYKRMAAYHAGGVPWRDAARYTYGELLAVYNGRHYSRGTRTRAPDIPKQEALAHSERVLRAIKAEYEDKA